MNKRFTFCLILTFLLTAIATAATLNVNPSGSGPYPTIQAAINAASGTDSILLEDGTYTGFGNYDLDFGGKSITVDSNSGNPANCIIDCQGNGRAFYFHNGETPASTVQNLTIKNGDSYYGGAIECEEASPTISNCIITNNAAAYGGAIDCFIASPVIVNCIITNNFADDDGSAIECSIESSPTIYNCLITGNNADGYGAIDCYDESSPEITNCTIANNTGHTDRGGVNAAYLSLPTIRNSILWNNGDDIYGVVPSDVNYSCIQDGDSGTGNISNNPLFKTGPLGDYYLIQTAAGQLPPDSNCVDAGGDSNDAIFGSGHSLTTRTDNVPDSGIVDMGFHYPGGGAAVQCVLITAVDPNGNYGAIDPNWPAPAGHSYNQFTEVPLEAIPDDNSYIVEKWTGADNNSTALTNVVTMDANHTVIVKFKPTVMCNLTTYVVGANGTIDSHNAEPFLKYSSITINAHPTGGYLVKQWTKETSDPCTYTVIAGPNLPPDPNKYTIIIDSNTVVTVEFMENPVKYLLDPRVSGGNGTISPKRGYYPGGMIIQLIATPDYGYKLKKWTGTNNDASMALTNTVTMTSGKTVYVEYQPKLQYRLTTTAASGATINPNYPAPGQLVYEDEVVPLTATIPLGSVVDWSGTDNDNTVALTNTVTMDANHTVTVSYHTPQIRHVPGQYTTIGGAVGAANNGDTIMISARLGNPYREWNIDPNGKIITISSEHPDDPCCVAATIIDCQNYGRAFILQSGETQDTVIEGLTIINGSAIFEPKRPFDTGGTGQYAVSLSLSGSNPLDPNAYGGAIRCTNGASPTISNCVFKNCRAEGRKGENASYVFSDLPDQNNALTALPPLAPLPPPAPGIDGQNGQNGQNGANGANGINGANGYNGGDGGDAYGGALYFDIGSNPKILHCKFTKCLAIGGNGGWGGLGQSGQDGQGGQPGQAGQAGQPGGPADPTGIPPVPQQGRGGNGGNGGNGGMGGIGGTGGTGGKGGMGGSSFGGAIYFAAQNNAIIQHSQVIDCNAVPGLGNSGGGAGNSGNGGAGAAGGAGGAAGSGREPAATAGSPGTNSRGTDGTNGSKGGDGSTNGNPCAGGIYFGDNCNIQISDTTFSGNHTTAKIVSFKYNAGNGGNGGNGGNDPASIGGNGGRGGDAGQAGNAGDGIYIGDGANGGNGGDGGGDHGRGGNGGNGSSGADVGGNGGQGGDGNPAGEDGHDGSDNLSPWWSIQSYAGSNHYGYSCIVTLNDCNFLKNYTAADSGGAEYYKGIATATMNNCTFGENLATGGAGGAQFFGWTPNNNIDINDCTYNKNSAVWHGGAVFAGYNVNLTVTDSTFADNVASDLSAYGGGIYWDNYGHHNKTASITNSYFTNNTAGFGGGLHWYDDDHLNTTTITNCVFADNYADHGGGLYWSRGAPTIASCIFKRNHTNDGGGGISSFTSGGIIKDCIITDNTTSGSGGGLYFGGGVPKLHNCLITNNSAVLDGGGTASYWSALPQITNCTIADNIAFDPVNSNYGRGGGISCSYESRTTMKDCILADNAATWGKQISIGSNGTKLDVSYSDIQNWHDANYPNHFNPDEIRIFTNGILNIDANNVIDDDPCLVQTYFLATNSPCIDTGSNLASTIGLNTYTTQTNNSLDSGTVDMGYHYAVKRLTLVVIGHGMVSVNEPNHYDPNTGKYVGSIFNLTAIPEAGYRVKSWTGTDESPCWNINTNTVTMTTDKTVTVEFEVKYNKTIDVFGDILSIQNAIDQAQNGDIIRIHDGTYVGIGFRVDRKTITIIGNPAHPENVIIDCAGERFYDNTRIGFVLVGDNQHSVTLDGLSIINSHTTATSPVAPEFPGDDGVPTKLQHDTWDAWSNYSGAITIQGNHTIKNCIIRNCSVSVDPATNGNPGGDPNDRDHTPPGHNKGGDGGYGGNAGGAGIFVQWGDANIINVTIENCYAFAGNAGNGATGYENLTDNYPAGASGRGGDGGSAFGAGIYVHSGSPYFKNVTVRNCGARAGNGGNGAIGAIGTNGGDGGLPGRVKGAGICYSVNSAPIFKGCKVENCRAYGGRGGNGGDGGQWREHYPATEGGYGGLTTEAAAGQGDIRMYSSNGGAVFCDNWSRGIFTDCAFIGNITYGSISGLGGIWHFPADWQEQPRQHYRVSSFGAGVFCSTYSSGTFNGCQFQENRTAYNQDFTDPNYLAAVGLTDISDYNGDLIGGGGGLCLWQTNTTTITDCNFITNAAPVGGGIYSFDSEIIISDCNVSDNNSYSGGGILAVDSTADIAKSLISRNIASTQPGTAQDTGQVDFGTGGGIYSLSSFLNITDTTITENSARITAGGICLDGDTSTIKNCLITDNKAAETGGGVAALYFAELLIQNCTIAENYVTDINGIGGGLFASYAAEVLVKDTIFWANTSFKGSQIALSNGNSDMPAKLSVTYSDIEEPNRQAVIQALDVVICIDTTGSMSNVIESIKDAAGDIVDRIAENTPDYRIAIVDFKDREFSPYFYKDDSLFTTNKAAIQTAINELYASGGAIWGEAVYSPLMHCIDGSSLGNWRSDTNVKKIIILMGDEEPQDPEPDTAYTLDSVTTAANNNNINIFSILTGIGVGNATVTSYFDGLAANTGGVLIETPDGSKAAEAVIRAIDLATLPPAPVYVESGSNLSYWDSINGWDDVNSHNIHLDPNFVLDYYLDYNSPCIDAGSTTAAALDLDTYTTRIDGIFDAGIVDMGFHHQAAVQKYNITVQILEDASYPGIHGTITADPNNLISYDANTATYTYKFYSGSSPILTAVPDANYYVKGWYDGIDTRVSISNTFSFTVDANDTYFVRFKPRRTIQVSGGGSTLRSAVSNAENGDTLIVAAGTYVGDVNIGGKQIKLYGVNPDDPNIVNRTIIDCSGGLRGFIFSGGETANTIINGFTIKNGGGDGINGGGIFINVNSSPLIVNVDISDCSALNASGGAIYISNGSSPEFRNVNITNCSATSNGGGVYISESSSPVFTDCSIADCDAGVNGGAVYCRTQSSPTFTGCSFSGNNASVSGGAIFYVADCYVTLIGCDFTENVADKDGGAVLCSTACIVQVNDCNFAGNQAEYAGGILLEEDCGGIIDGTTFNGNKAIEDGGAIYITDSNAIEITNCNISTNTALRGGGIFALVSPKVTITNCRISSNGTPAGDLVGEGGGIFGFASFKKIADCQITGNTASTSGGGIYIGGDQEDTNYPLIKNCLITNNKSTRDGGGISVNWFATAKVQNCTITGNQATNANGQGGGLYCSYAGETLVKDTIFWANSSVDGSQIAVGSGDLPYPLPAIVNITYSDVDLREGTDFNSLLVESGTGTGTTTGILVDSQTINNEITASGSAKVIVSLAEPAGAQTTNWSSPASVSSLRSQITTLQNQVLSTFSTGEFTLRQKLTNVAVFSGQVTQAGLNKLMSNPSVAHIEPVRMVHPMLAQAIPLANALDTRPVYNGSGISIAIVDSGVDYTHPRLGGGGFPNSKVIGGYDTGDNDNNPMPSDEAHGTCCAGIAAGMLGTVGDYIGGVAYNAKIYALKLTTNTGQWPTDSDLAAWDWCITHRNDDPANPISVMSNSWGIYSLPFNNAAEADAYSPAHKTAAQTAVNAGITILAASGNDGFAGQGISWPAAMSNVISVGAVYDTTDQVTGYSNTADILDILAPADPVYTTDIVGAGGYDPGDYFPYFNGTSSACPFAAGSVAALQSAAKQLRGEYLTPSQIRILLRITGDPVTDTKVAITKPRVNLGTAIALLSGSVPISCDTGCIITGFAQDANSNWIVADHNNIAEDPNFVFDHYLDYNSPCIDAGSTTAAALDLDTYTTRIDGIFDAGIVDMGFHHQAAVQKYDITVQILEDANYPGIHGTITADPNNRISDANDANTYIYRFYAGTAPTLTAIPDANYFIKGWYDKNNTRISEAESITFTVDSNDTYFVRFRPARIISVSGGGDALRNAVSNAENGDTLIVAAGIYNGGIDIAGKQIKLYGVNPDDPCVIQKVIVDGGGHTGGFIFASGQNSNTTINGFIITNCNSNGSPGAAIFIDANSSPTIANVDISDCNLTNANGGAIYVGPHSSSRFARVHINNCQVTNAHGGAIYVSTEANPAFIDCSVTNCRANGGSGGAVYCSIRSMPTFINCSVTDCNADIKGGAIYCHTGCESQFERCRFVNNSAIEDGGAIFYAFHNTLEVDDCNFTGNSAEFGAAVFADVNCAGILKNTTFSKNAADEDGGAIHITGSGAIGVADCNITKNTATRGGGIFALSSPKVIIIDCQINFNKAYKAVINPNDPNSIIDDFICEGGGIYSFDGPALIENCRINDNNSNTSGGGIYVSGESEPNIHNCLIINNIANRDGGGVSANWYAQLTLSNCTIVENSITGGGFASGYGGGLSCAYEAHTKVINSIFWNNNAEYGRAISIGSSFDAADKLPAEVDVSYSDVKDGTASVFVDTAHGCVLNWDAASNLAGTSLTSPLFVTGFWGNYYLSQIDTDDPCQTVDSPCVDAGSGSAIDNGMFRHTTRTDHVIDIADSNVDMGYHYTLSAEILGDFDLDGDVDFADLALFMLYWLDDNCTFPYWCYGTDLNEDGGVDFEDYALFAENYGQHETTPPQPDPMTWATIPRSTGLHEITMTATTAMDRTSGSQVQYYFDETTGNPGATDSGWITNSTYVDTGLTSGTQYGYRVKARDAQNNETGWSDPIRYATPGATDTTPPTPNPMTWATVPYATSLTSIAMVATTATDTAGVEYYFDCNQFVSPGCHDCNWQDSTTYVDSGLDPNTTYTYRVKARDKSIAHNETQYSDQRSATTSSVTPPPPVDANAPTPNPSQWAFIPKKVQGLDANYPSYMWYHQMTAVTATDASPPVMYYFQGLYGGMGSGGWITFPLGQPATYIAGPFLTENIDSAYRVYTKDSATPTNNIGLPSPTYHLRYGYITP